MTEPRGILLVDKPAGLSSFDIIRVLRRETGIRKIGHAGTLDPLATGLMIILVGKATKLSGSLLKLDKEYLAEFKLGQTSETGDEEGEKTFVSDWQPSTDQISGALQEFIGSIRQRPHSYSAIKVGGVRAYKAARKGLALDIPEREVTVHRLDLADYDYPLLQVASRVSSGTYIRTLAEDIGKKLGTGAYLSSLRRIRVGEYEIASAHPLKAINRDNFNNYLIKTD